VQIEVPQADEQVTPLPSGAQSVSVVHGRTQAKPPELQTPSAAGAANVMHTRPLTQGGPPSRLQGAIATPGELEHAEEPATEASSTAMRVFMVRFPVSSYGQVELSWGSSAVTAVW
jgi:hypothetical protein